MLRERMVEKTVVVNHTDRIMQPGGNSDER